MSPRPLGGAVVSGVLAFALAFTGVPLTASAVTQPAPQAGLWDLPTARVDVAGGLGIVPMAPVADCAGNLCGSVTMTSVVVGGGPATTASWNLRAQNSANANWYDFTSGQTRTVTKPATYTMSAISTNSAVTVDYATTVNCVPGNSFVTVVGATVTFPSTGSPANRSVACTFTHTYVTATRATINVQIGSDRVGLTGVTGLAGVRLQLYDGTTAPTTAVTDTWATCTSTAAGVCSFIVPFTGPGQVNENRQFWIRQAAAPAGYFTNPQLRTGNGDGTGSQATDYTFRTGTLLQAGQTYSSQNASDFMLGSGASDRTASGGVWQDSRNNPSPPSSCGLDVALLLDLSGSVGSAVTNLKAAADTFINSLVGTPSRASLFSFSTVSPAVNATRNYPDLTPVATQAQANTFTSRYATWTANGGTNWDRGLASIAESAEKYDVAIVITDGSPSYYNDPAQGPGNFTRLRDVEAGIFSSNAIKAQNTRVIAFGVGTGASGLTSLNLRAISGATLNSDYYQTTDYAQAGATLRALALGACASSLTVVKQIVPPSGTIAQATPGTGWTFTPSTATPGVVLPPAGVTDTTGGVNFPITFPGATTTAPVTVTETQQAGYTLVQQGAFNASCTNLQTSTAVAVTNVGATGFTVAASSTDPISCTVYNRAPQPPASITVNKTWVINGTTYADGAQPAQFQAQLRMTGPAGAGASDQGWGVPRTGFSVGNSTTLSEIVTTPDPALCTTQSQLITVNGSSAAPLPQTLPAAVSLTLPTNTAAVRNTVTCQSRLTLVKQVIGGTVAATAWNLQAVGVNGQTLSGATGAAAVTDVTVAPNVRYQLRETGGDPRYVQDDNRTDLQANPLATGSATCIRIDAQGNPIVGFSDGINGGVDVPIGARVKCTLTNRTAQVILLKHVVNDNGGTAAAPQWTLAATPSGAPIAGLNPVTGIVGNENAVAANTFLVRPDHPYTVTESGGPAGYAMGIECLTDTDPIVTWTRLLDVALTAPAGQTTTCRVVNDDIPATLTLVKQVTTTGQPGALATPYNWTVTAAPVLGTIPTTVSGRGQTGQNDATPNPQVTAQQVWAGVFQLSEASDGSARVAGYAQQGSWSCTSAAGTVVLPNGLLTVASGQSYTCSVRNVFQVGALAITKTVTGPSGSISNPQSVPFTAQYTCTFNGQTVGPTQVTVNPAALGSAGPAVTVPNLPAGALCTVAELNPPTGSSNLTNTSYVWLAPIIGPPDTVTVPVGGTVTVNVTNPIQQQVGSLRIGKTITARDGTPQGGYTGGAARTFPMTYTCTIGATQTASGTVDVSTGSPATVAGIPATSVCTVSESVVPQGGDFLDASFEWDGSTTTPTSATITVDAAATVGVTNYFLRNFANLVISKVVTGSGYSGTGPDFTVSWDCGAPYQGSQAIAAAASTPPIQVPAGVACNIIETPPAADLLSPGYVWLDPVFDGFNASGEIVIPEGQTGTVTVTNPNELAYSRIVVQKAILDNASAVLPGTTFTLNVSCTAPAQGDTADYSEDFTLTWPDSLVAVSDYLPIATPCTVSEVGLPSGSDGLTDGSYAWGPAPASQDVEVPASTTPTPVTVTNTITRVTAPFGIAKNVVNTFPVTANGPFSGDFSCTYAGDAPITGTWTRIGAGAATLTLTGGPSADTVPVLVGSSCTATETAAAGPVPGDASYTWSIQQPGPVTVPAAGATATVTNTVNRFEGSFTLTKSVSGGDPGVAYDADAEFVFDYSCTSAGGETVEGTLTVQVGVSAGVADVPGDSTCVVTENQALNPDPIDPYRWDSVAFTQTGAESASTNGPSITFVTTDDAVVVNVAATNTISPRTASVVVEKTVVDPDGGFTGGDEPIFPITVTCDALTLAPQSVGDGGSVRFDGIPLGSTCAATEGSPTPQSLADGSFAWGAPVIGAPVELDVADTDYTIAVTNPIVRVTAPIDIVKVFTDNGYTGVVDPATIYSGTWVCTYVGAGPTTTVEGEWSGTGSSSGTLAVTTGDAGSVLVGSVCGVTEVTPPPPSAVDPSYRWGTPGLQGVTVAPVPGTNRMQVSNSLERDTGDLRVAKQITGETGGYVGDDDPAFTGFPVSAICYLNGPDDDVVMQGIVGVKPGDEVPLLTGVPAGWTCDVTETAVPGQLFDASYRWGTAVVRIDGAEATQTEVVAGETALVEVENPIERVTGGIDIVKALDSSIPAGVVVDAAFQGAYTCEYQPGTSREELFSGTWSVAALSAGSTSAVLDGDEEFPVGTSCSVTEDAPTGGLKDDSWAWGAAIIPAPVLVTETPAASLTITNTVTRVWAGLSVTKAYAGIDGAIADPDLEVTGSWSCTYDGAPVGGGSGTWTLPAAGGTTTVVAPADGVLPATSVCTVTEATLDNADLVDGSYRWDAAQFAPAGGVVTLPADGVGAATVTNSTVRVTAAFQVTKALELGPDVLEARIDPTLEFGGTYSCQYGTDDAVTGAWGPIHVNEVWQSTPDLFVGSVCTVTETDRPAEPVPGDPSHAWGDAIGDTVTVAEPEAALARAIVTNPVERVEGTIRITKAYAADTPAGVILPDTSFTGTYACDFGPGLQSWQGVWSVTGTGDATLVPTGTGLTADFPLGTTCEVAEDPLDPADLLDPSWAWAEPLVDPVAVVVSDPAVPAVATVTNGVARVSGGFSVTKAVDGTADPDLTYQGDFQCVYTPTDPQVPAVTVDGTWGPIAAGETWTSAADAGIPLGSSCAVTTESRAANPVADDLSFRWIEPFDPGSPVLAATNATSAIVTVTNRVVRITGAFGVAKTVLGDTEGIAPDAGYDFTWSCTAGDGEVFPQPSPGSFTLQDGEVWSVPSTEAVPIGSVCTVIEGAPPAPVDPSFAWSTALSVAGAVGTPGESSITFTLAGDDGAVLVSAANTLTRTVGTYTISKTSDPGAGGTVLPGESITYTVTVTPGTAGFVDDVVVTDDLTEVLANSSLDEATIAASAGTADLSGTRLVWSLGRVGPGEPLTLSYTIVVNDNAFGVRLRNVVSADGEEPPADCEPCATTHVTPRWVLSKSSDPASGSTVLPGQTIVYTLTAGNVSEARIPDATVTDDLSGVLPYAELVEPLDAGLTLTGTTLSWAVPALEPGQIRSTSYAVTLTDAAIGATLQNVAVPDQPTGACSIDMPAPRVAAAAAAAIVDPACSTTHVVPQWTLQKTSNPPSGWPVGPGSDVTFTLTAVNSSAAIVTGAQAQDDLSLALARSGLVLPLASGLALSGTDLLWMIPQLQPGESASVSYTLHVRADAAAGPLPNSVIPLGAGGDCVVCETEHTVAPGLPPTGAVAPIGAAMGGLLLLIGGTAFWMIGRRRRERTDPGT